MPVSTRRKFTRKSPSIDYVKSTTPPTPPNPTNALRHEAANIHPPEEFGRALVAEVAKTLESGPGLIHPPKNFWEGRVEFTITRGGLFKISDYSGPLCIAMHLPPLLAALDAPSKGESILWLSFSWFSARMGGTRPPAALLIRFVPSSFQAVGPRSLVHYKTEHKKS